MSKIDANHAPFFVGFHSFYMLVRFDPALHLRRLGGVGRESFDEALLLGKHRLLPREGRFLVRVANRTLPLVEVVVA